MKKAGVMVRNRRKYKETTNSNHKQPVFDNLVSRQFDVDKKDSVYAGDITYIWTQEGWLYLACLLYTSPSPRDATLSRMPSSA